MEGIPITHARERRPTENEPTATYEPPRILELGTFWEQTLIGKQGSLTDGIHIQRLGGTIHDSSV